MEGKASEGGLRHRCADVASSLIFIPSSAGPLVMAARFSKWESSRAVGGASTCVLWVVGGGERM